jgi:polyisoprenoid-binding protein YceI
MSNVAKIIVGIALVVAIVGSVLAFSVLRTPEEASAPIEAIPLGATGTPTIEAVAEATVAPTNTAAPPTEAAATTVATITEATAVETTEAATAVEETMEATAAADTTTATAAEETAASPILAQIVQAESEARFIIDEVLNNAPKTVIGTTDQVAGEISVDPSNPDNTRVGVIQINARTLTTDNDFRNRAIKNAILQTDSYEFITFTPTAINGLPEAGTVGQTYTFQIVGDLTIRDVTKQVTFDVTATPVSETRLEGTVLYADYGITIPSVRSVASVEDEVRLELDFVATPTS